jgi:hypothetical protein
MQEMARKLEEMITIKKNNLNALIKQHKDEDG